MYRASARRQGSDEVRAAFFLPLGGLAALILHFTFSEWSMIFLLPVVALGLLTFGTWLASSPRLRRSWVLRRDRLDAGLGPSVRLERQLGRLRRDRFAGRLIGVLLSGAAVFTVLFFAFSSEPSLAYGAFTWLWGCAYLLPALLAEFALWRLSRTAWFESRVEARVARYAAAHTPGVSHSEVS